MIIIDLPLLATFRVPGSCEYCGRKCEVREAAHLWAKGAGGGGRLDLRVNLAGLGGPFLCACHHRLHQGELEPFPLLANVADREGVTVHEIADAIAEFRRLDKVATIPPHLARFVGPTAQINPRRERRAVRHPRCQMEGCRRSTQGKSLFVGTKSICPGCFKEHLKGAVK